MDVRQVAFSSEHEIVPDRCLILHRRKARVDSEPASKNLLHFVATVKLRLKNLETAHLNEEVSFCLGYFSRGFVKLASGINRALAGYSALKHARVFDRSRGKQQVFGGAP